MLGLLLCLSESFQVFVVFSVLVGWKICMFGMVCSEVSVFIGWWVGLFLFSLIELCVSIQIIGCFISDDKCMELW